MAFITLADVKAHARLTVDDSDFDTELTRLIPVAESKVVSFLNRRVYEMQTDLPTDEDARDTDMVFTDEMKNAMLEVASYYHEYKSAINNEFLNQLLEALVGHIRVLPI